MGQKVSNPECPEEAAPPQANLNLQKVQAGSYFSQVSHVQSIQARRKQSGKAKSQVMKGAHPAQGSHPPPHVPQVTQVTHNTQNT